MVPMGEDGNARACAFVEMAASGQGRTFGVGIDSNIVTASIRALINGVNRLTADSVARDGSQAA